VVCDASTLLSLRRYYRPNRPRTWMEEGLNQMTIQRFRALVAASEFALEQFSLTPIRHVPSLLPAALSEHTTAHVNAVLLRTP
jgi:hypothetical protein